MIAGVLLVNNTPDTYSKEEDPNTILQAVASFWTEKCAWVADKRNYEVRVGASSIDILLKQVLKYL